MVNLSEYLVYRQKHCIHNFIQYTDEDSEDIQNICIFCQKEQYPKEEEEKQSIYDTLLSTDKTFTTVNKEWVPRICACMGAMFGEPYCPCEMERRDLPLNTIEREKQQKEAQRQLDSIDWSIYET